jgi:hypothetical protein
LEEAGAYGAGDETRTRDIFLGKEVLYQLSYTRNEKEREETRIKINATQVNLAKAAFDAAYRSAM